MRSLDSTRAGEGFRGFHPLGMLVGLRDGRLALAKFSSDLDTICASLIAPAEGAATKLFY